MRFRRMAPTTPDVSIRVRMGLVMFEATPVNFQSQLATIQTLIDRANRETGP